MSEFEFEIKPGRRLPRETLMPLPEMSYEQELLNTPVPFENRVEFLSDYVKLTQKEPSLSSLIKALGITAHQAQAMTREVGAISWTNAEDETVFKAYTLEVLQEELAWQALFDQLDEKLSARSIADYLGVSQPWVQRAAYGLGVYPVRDIGKTGRETELYPKSTVAMLRTILLHFPPANDTYALSEVTGIVKKSPDWVRKTVDDRDLLFVMRKSAVNGRMVAHYPEETVKALSTLAAEYLPAGNWMTEFAIAQYVNRDPEWVRPRLIPFYFEMRLTIHSKPAVHYPPEVYEYLKKKAAEIPPADGWMTEQGIATKLGRTFKWVNARTASYKDVSETRLQEVNNRPRTHYPPIVFEELEVLSNAQRLAKKSNSTAS